jgi:hypothetical protein
VLKTRGTVIFAQLPTVVPVVVLVLTSCVQEKKEQVTTQKSWSDFEAQMIAEALAAVQANEAVQASKKPRSASADAASAGRPSAVQSGPMYMLRVVGSEFSFYSMHPAQMLMDVLPLYSKVPEINEGKQELPITSAFKLNINNIDTFKFTDNKHREIILNMLSALLSHISTTQEVKQ